MQGRPHRNVAQWLRGPVVIVPTEAEAAAAASQVAPAATVVDPTAREAQLWQVFPLCAGDLLAAVQRCPDARLSEWAARSVFQQVGA
jgi:hypothetical protein